MRPPLTTLYSQLKQPQTSTNQRPDSAQPQRSLSPHSQRRQRASQSAALEIKPDPADSETRELPARHTSKLDPNANPIHPATGKPIMSTDFDTDFSGDNSKPWRRPGADITDYFNYGFDEFTWASYCLKQKDMPKEVKAINAEAEQMKAFVEGIGGPGMPGVPTGPAGGQGAAAAVGGVGAGGMGGMQGMPSEAEMQQMFQSMMSQGMDPSQMDQNTFMQSMMGMGMGGGMQGGPPSGPSGFGGGDGGFQGGGGGGYGGGGGRGRGRRGRGNW